MSRYLVDQVERHPKIELVPHSTVCELHGPQGDLQAIELTDQRDGSHRPLDVRALFIFIGTQPCTSWLADSLALDEDGFILSGRDVPAAGNGGRDPLPLETSRAGVFAAGDVRSGSMKRVASAVGEARWRCTSSATTSPVCAAERGPALVVGAGLAGLTAAIALRRQGFEARVFERREPRGCTQAPASTWATTPHALASLGLLERLKAVSAPATRLECSTTGGSFLGCSTRPPRNPRSAWCGPRSTTCCSARSTTTRSSWACAWSASSRTTTA